MNMPGSKAGNFYNSDGFAILGMSRSRKNFAWTIYDGFVKSGMPVFPVHPSGGEIKGVRFYDSLAALPRKVEAAVVSLNVSKADHLLSRLKENGVKKIWFQQGSYDNNVLKKADDLEFETYTGCAMMYLPGTLWLHRVHRFFHELVSKGKG